MWYTCLRIKLAAMLLVTFRIFLRGRNELLPTALDGSVSYRAPSAALSQSLSGWSAHGHRNVLFHDEVCPSVGVDLSALRNKPEGVCPTPSAG